MGNPAWHSITSIYGTIGLIGIIMLIFHRNNPYIKFRDSKFLIIQNIGSYVACLINVTYLAERPHYSCYAYYAGSLFVYSFFLLPLSIRMWEYCVNFHISKVRSKVSFEYENRDNVLLPNWGENSWFFRNRWVIKPRNLNVFFVVFFFLLMTPYIPYLVTGNEYEYNDKTGTCKVPSSGTIVIIVIAIVMFALFAVIVYLMKGSRDSYYVKQEVWFLGVTWIICIVAWIPFTLISLPFLKVISGAFVFMLGELFSTVWCCFFPLYLVYRKPIITAQIGDASINGEFKNFVAQLENLRYRNALHDFLKLQFCQENIIFYEAVTNWRRMPLDDSQRIETAHFIHDNYVTEEGLCQVNLPADMRTKIAEEIRKGGPISETIFDLALKEVLEMIYTNSLLSFSTHPLYKTAA